MVELFSATCTVTGHLINIFFFAKSSTTSDHRNGSNDIPNRSHSSRDLNDLKKFPKTIFQYREKLVLNLFQFGLNQASKQACNSLIMFNFSPENFSELKLSITRLLKACLVA